MKVILPLSLNLILCECDSSELNTFFNIFTPQLFQSLQWGRDSCNVVSWSAALKGPGLKDLHAIVVAGVCGVPFISTLVCLHFKAKFLLRLHRQHTNGKLSLAEIAPEAAMHACRQGRNQTVR